MSKSLCTMVTLLALSLVAAVRADGPAEAGQKSHRAAAKLAKEPAPHWLGLFCEPAGETLRAQLGLGEGLVVDQVLPDGPAAKADLRPHDVLLKAGGKPLKDVPDLIEAIAGAKDKPLTLELLRGGKRQSITVTPAPRPAEGVGQITVTAQGPNPEVEKLLKQFGGQLNAQDQPLQFQFFHPGQILPPGATVPPPAANAIFSISGVTMATSLSDGYTVVVQREEGKPARITVTRGKEKWEATEGKLDRLPEKVRPEVEKLLAQGTLGVTVATGSAALFQPGAPATTGIITAGAVPVPMLDARVDQRLDELSREVKELRKAVEELKAKAKSKK